MCKMRFEYGWGLNMVGLTYSLAKILKRDSKSVDRPLSIKPQWWFSWVFLCFWTKYKRTDSIFNMFDKNTLPNNATSREREYHYILLVSEGKWIRISILHLCMKCFCFQLRVLRILSTKLVAVACQERKSKTWKKECYTANFISSMTKMEMQSRENNFAAKRM